MVSDESDDMQAAFRNQFLTSVKGTHHWISGKYFNSYLNEFIFKYENRKESMMPVLVERIVNG